MVVSTRSGGRSAETRADTARTGETSVDTGKAPSSRFLVVGQDCQIAEAIRSVFDQQQHDVLRVASPQEALRLLVEQGADVLVLPQRMFRSDRCTANEGPASAMDLDAVRMVGELLKALSRAKAEESDISEDAGPGTRSA
jgi:CheY-like chemotaxis protein